MSVSLVSLVSTVLRAVVEDGMIVEIHLLPGDTSLELAQDEGKGTAHDVLTPVVPAYAVFVHV